jgi:hypothetical protein
MFSKITKKAWIGIAAALILAGAAIVHFASGEEKLNVESSFDPYEFKPRVGVKNINIEQNRQLLFFGFKGVEGVSRSRRLDLSRIRSELKGGGKDIISDIILTIKEGAIVDTTFQGDYHGVNEYVRAVVKLWQRSFTDFIDVQVQLRIKKTGTIDVIFKELKATQPTTEVERFLNFHTISDNKADMKYIFPVYGYDFERPKFNENTEFKKLQTETEKWRKLPIPAELKGLFNDEKIN